MKIRLWVTAAFMAALFTAPRAAWSLTTDQFLSMCMAGGAQCHQHPAAQAYVGGALDLIATLDEQTDYLSQVYCKAPRDLFDVPKVIQFMVEHQQGYGDRNAMLLLVRYLEVHGGCKR